MRGHGAAALALASSADTAILDEWLARARPYRPHQAVVELSEAPHVHFVRSGWAARSRMLLDGRRQIVDVLLGGDQCGLELTPFQRRESHVALTPCDIATIPLAEVAEAMHRDPALSEALTTAIRLRRALTEELLVSLGRRTALERAAHFFCTLLLRQGGAEASACEMPLRQPELADILGLSTVHMNRTMQVLRRSGFVEIGRGRLKAHDLDKLRTLGDFDPDFLTLA